jgi:hypothetical protein
VFGEVASAAKIDRPQPCRSLAAIEIFDAIHDNVG